MKVRLFSDLHNEFTRQMHKRNYEIPELPDDSETVLILAGDIDVGKHAWYSKFSYC